MSALTKDELLKLIKDTVSSQVAEAVEAIHKSQAQREQGWMEKVLAGVAGRQDDKPIIEKGQVTARLIRALAAGKGDVDRATKFVKKEWGGDEAVIKALDSGTAVAGGFLVPEPLAAEIIEFLRPASVVRRMGPMVIPMPVGQIRIPKLTAGSAASYIGENRNLPATEPRFGQVALTFKKLAALVPVSNDLLRYSSPGADSIVRNDLVRAMAQREDAAFIRDDGTAHTPKGLRNWVVAAQLIAANAVVNLANVTTDLGKVVLALKNQNVPMTNPGWLMAPRTEFYLMTVQNANGFFVFRDEMMRGTLWGIKYATTTQIPTNLAAGTGSELYLVDFDDACIGEAKTLVLDASTEAAYHDGTNVQAAFSLDQTVVRCIAEHDFVMRRDQAVAILNGLTWGS